MSTVDKRSENYTKDADGVAVGSMAFYVDVRPNGAAIEALGLDPEGTYYNAPFPGDPTAVCDALDAEPAADGVGTEIVARFSNDGRYKITSVLSRQFDVPYFDRTFEKVQVDIPVSIRDTVMYSPVSGGTPEPTRYWRLDTIKRVEKRPIRLVTIKVRLTGAAQLLLNNIEEQQDKLHQFSQSSRLWRFEAGAIKQSDPDVFMCPYSWIGDYGTIRTPDMVDNANKIIWPLPYPGYPNHLRKPFSEFIVFPTEDSRNIPHDIRVIEMYDRTDLQGWRTLPGVPQWL